MTQSDAVELPCAVCGQAAVRLDLRGATAHVPKKIMLAMKGMMRAAGAPLDTDSATFGLDVETIARGLAVTCISCVDHQEAANG